ncbi:MAG: dynamin family protein [Chloroflexi bacterium]|nr:dynamin family protein [Chloroflexota bacterium]
MTINAQVTALDGPLAALRESEIRLLNEMATTLTDVGEQAQEDRQRLLEIAQDLRAAFFLVVVIGEFNAGKSSFINALLGEELLPMGITPTTEAIELIRYGEIPTRTPQLRESGIREWTHPNTGAPGVAIVDTPGTGSVFQKHEHTAKSFLHRSDLVIFVISAKRAFAETERLYLELAKNYGKKIILVMNQIDLLKPNEQQEVRRFVESQVFELLGIQPLLFMVSAKEALAARRQRDGAESGAESGIGGVEAVRAHLRGVFSEISPAKQKLLTQLDTAERIIGKHAELVKSNADHVAADTGKVRDVQSEFQRQAQGLNEQLRSTRDEIDKVLEGIRERGMVFIDSQLSIRRIGRTLNKEAMQQEFQSVVIGRALRDVNEATGDYVNAVIDHSRLYWRGVIDRLNQLKDVLEQEIGGLDAGVYAEQRESLQEAIRIAENELKTYSKGDVLDDLRSNFQSNMTGFTVTSLVAAGGLIFLALEAITRGPLIAGAVGTIFPPVAIAASAVSGIFAWRYVRNSVSKNKNEFNARVDQLLAKYHTALDELVQKERARLTQYGNQVLTPIFSRLDVLAQRYANQQATFRAHQQQIEALRTGVQESK